ncbi:DUF1071 domain-containing protein [Leuconostoc citreum]|uniref:DUF1071 domain-containing protein n=1 Tax=Leuconostoc citreum TaxID=33964 RepID=UPI0021A4CC6B|nr:DUF1071 domain-containing protein [Leuconostoc citreum]MCT3056479.1 DUF1071 domain-containing protein [Leuconostoc citreum]MCT3060848.1 DUF1071 domain-containing protein [Leuconostoc citreum]
MSEEKPVFKVLNEIDVSAHVDEKKGGYTTLKYLSWSWAWATLKKEYPDATYEIEKFENNLPYVYDENTGYMVFTNVTINGITHEMWLPVMDGANQAMKNKPYSYKTKKGDKQVAAATMFDVNKTVMRCLVKNLAMFGLGLYIYSGEDLPEVEPEPPKKITDDQRILLEKIINETSELSGQDMMAFTLKAANVSALKFLTEENYKPLLAKVTEWHQKSEEKANEPG